MTTFTPDLTVTGLESHESAWLATGGPNNGRTFKVGLFMHDKDRNTVVARAWLLDLAGVPIEPYAQFNANVSLDIELSAQVVTDAKDSAISGALKAADNKSGFKELFSDLPVLTQ